MATGAAGEWPAAAAVKVLYLKPELRAETDVEGRAIPGTVPFVDTKAQRVAATKEATVEVFDARPALDRGELSLDTNGFVLVPHKTQCPSFRDVGAIRRTYYPEMCDLVKRVTGAAHAVVTNHAVRTEEDYGFSQETDGDHPYAVFALMDGNDSYVLTAPKRFARLARKPTEKGGLGGAGIPPGEEGEYDYLDYNLWQPFDREVQQNPFAVLDARTLDREDISPFHTRNRIAVDKSSVAGETEDKELNIVESMMLLANPRHRWCFFPWMRPDELLLFMGQKHPETDAPHPGSGRNTAHVSFFDPRLPAAAPARRSVETRVLAAFPKPKKAASKL